MKNKILFFVILCLVGCGGVKHRIEKNQDYFDDLTVSQRQLIEKRKIAEGFTSKMVYLAWGNPSQKKTKVAGKKTTETWIYSSAGTNYRAENIRVYDRHRRRYVIQTYQIPYDYYTISKYVVLQNGKVIEYAYVNETYTSPYSPYIRNPAGHFGLISPFARSQFNEMVTPQILRLKEKPNR